MAGGVEDLDVFLLTIRLSWCRWVLELVLLAAVCASAGSVHNSKDAGAYDVFESSLVNGGKRRDRCGQLPSGLPVRVCVPGAACRGDFR